jgi:hypothetical protein
MLSVTLPATRLAVAGFDPVLVGMARALLPAIPAALLLFLTRQKRPTRPEIGSLLIASIGIVTGEHLGWREVGFTALIVLVVAASRRMPIRHKPA